MKKLELDSVIIDIKSIVSENSAPIKRIGVFGSLARGKFNNDSDIDIAVEYDYKQGDEYNAEKFIKFCEICETLSDVMYKLYERKIDVVHVEDKHGTFLYDIQDEVIWV